MAYNTELSQMVNIRPDFVLEWRCGGYGYKRTCVGVEHMCGRNFKSLAFFGRPDNECLW